MNPLSAHPPRTPRTSVATTPFSSQLSAAEKEESGENPHELEVELDEEEEEEDVQENSAAQNRIRPQEVCRELLETSAGRDKAFVLHFTSPSTTSTDCLWHQ